MMQTGAIMNAVEDMQAHRLHWCYMHVICMYAHKTYMPAEQQLLIVEIKKDGTAHSSREHTYII